VEGCCEHGNEPSGSIKCWEILEWLTFTFIIIIIIIIALYHEDIWGSGGIAPPFLNSALDGGEWSASGPGRFNTGEGAPRYPLGTRLGGPQSRYGHCGEDKYVAPVGNQTPAVRPVALRYV
jgi:hypothetical protein